MGKPGQVPLSNGPIRTCTGPLHPKFALDSDRREIEYLLSYPFHLIDPDPWSPIEFVSQGARFTIYKPLGVISTHAAESQLGNEEVDGYCTVIRMSTPLSFELSADHGWKIVRRLLEWIRVKCRHYWLLHGIGGFGAAYRGTVLVRDGKQISQQNVAMYGPNVIVNPLTREVWSTLAVELGNDAEVPLADSIYCDSLVSIVADAPMKALLEAGVAMEIALTKLLVDVSNTAPANAAKGRFVKKEGDRDPFGKKLSNWTKELGREPPETFSKEGISPGWHDTVLKMHKLRNGVAHAGAAPVHAFHDVTKGMFAAGALIQYCRTQRQNLGLDVFSMPTNVSPWQQVRFCHDGRLSVTSGPSSATLP